MYCNEHRLFSHRVLHCDLSDPWKLGYKNPYIQSSFDSYKGTSVSAILVSFSPRGSFWKRSAYLCTLYENYYKCKFKMLELIKYVYISCEEGF